MQEWAGRLGVCLPQAVSATHHCGTLGKVHHLLVPQFSNQ